MNAYVLQDEGRLLIIDTGYGVPEAQSAIASMLEHIGHSVTDIRQVIATHLHADHCGSAGWIRAFSGASVAMHPDDARLLAPRYQEQVPMLEATERWAVEVGAPASAAEAAMAQVARWREQFVDVVPDRLIEDGEMIEHGRFRLRALHTPGHTPGHLCFYEEATGAMFTGDTVLPRITYSPTLRPFASEDPLGQYLGSLERLADFRPTWALPGHQDPFDDLPGRITELRAHHRKRSERSIDLVRLEARTAWEVARELPRTRSWSEVRPAGQLSAVGEVYAHLQHLRSAGKLTTGESLPHRWSVASHASAEAGKPQSHAPTIDEHKESE